MNEIIKKDILDVVEDVIEILSLKEDRDVVDLKELSNHTIHNASIFQDEQSVSMAILIYSLSKVIERKQYQIPYPLMISLFKQLKSNMEQENLERYDKLVKRILTELSQIDTKLKVYVDEITTQASIKKGSRLYEHGISLARSAEVLGITQWDLMNYVGKIEIADIPGEITHITKRLKFTRELFK